MRPSRENVISTPTPLRNVCARRNRPARARGFFAHGGFIEVSSRALSAHKRNRSDAVLVQVSLSPIIVRTHVANGSASIMLSIAGGRPPIPRKSGSSSRLSSYAKLRRLSAIRVWLDNDLYVLA